MVAARGASCGYRNRLTVREAFIEFMRPLTKRIAAAAGLFMLLAAVYWRLVLFPSYMWHGTVPFAGDEPRLTVAFDLVRARP